MNRLGLVCNVGRVTKILFSSKRKSGWDSHSSWSHNTTKNLSPSVNIFLYGNVTESYAILMEGHKTLSIAYGPQKEWKFRPD